MRTTVIVVFRTRGVYESGTSRESYVRRALKKRGLTLIHIIGRESTTYRGVYPKTVLFTVEAKPRTKVK